jgi:uncharacterized repeat protein (TIGR01451 family)
MIKPRAFTVAGVLQIVIAVLLGLTLPEASATLFSNQSVAASEAMLGVTPTFTATATDSPTPTNIPDSTPITPPPATRPPSSNPRLTITKRANPSQVPPGGQTTFTIEVCNEGNKVAENVVVSDALPPELTLISASASQGKVVTEGNNVRAELGSIWPGYCAEVTIVVQVRPDVPPGTQIRNVASVGESYSDTTITSIPGLLPESGGVFPRFLAAALFIIGMGLLIAAPILKKPQKVKCENQ